MRRFRRGGKLGHEFETNIVIEVVEPSLAGSHSGCEWGREELNASGAKSSLQNLKECSERYIV